MMTKNLPSHSTNFTLRKTSIIILAIIAIISLAATFIDGIYTISFDLFRYNAPWQGAEFIAAIRLLEGKALYPDLTTDAGYYLYGPFSPMLFAGAMAIFGINLWVPKLLALIAYLFISMGIYSATCRLSNSKLLAIASAGLFSSFYLLTQCSFFNIRPDIFGSSLAIWGFIFAWKHVKEPNNIYAAAIASILFALSCLTKQNYILMPIVYVAYMLFIHSWRSAWQAFWPGVTLLAIILTYFNIGEEHFFLTTSLFSHHNFDISYLFADRLLKWVPTTLIAIFSLALIFSSSKNIKEPLFILSMMVAAFVLGFVSYLKVGGDFYALPLFTAFISILAPILIIKVKSNAVAATIAILMIIPIGQSLLNIIYSSDEICGDPFIPTTEMNIFIQNNSDLKIWFPFQPYRTYLLANGQYYHDDHVTGTLEDAGSPPPSNVLEKIENQYFDIIIGTSFSTELRQAISQYYESTEYEMELQTIHIRKNDPSLKENIAWPD